MPQEEMLSVKGAKGTFLISVLFRQNATWQGSILWTEQKKKQNFRSALEMIKLIDEALAMDSDLENPLEWN